MAIANDQFDVGTFIEVIELFRTGLRTHMAVINRLNVFPVPDGDTGTNMLATVDAVMEEIESLGDLPTMAQVGGAIAHGSLMGARGNSGVILCQILRGLATAAKDADLLGMSEIAAGLSEGSAAAEKAVLRPAEGTILTVARDAAVAATAVKQSASLGDGLIATRDAAVKSVARTPELLSVLADAGVVDAGGAGLTLLYEALVATATSSAMPPAVALPDAVAQRVAEGAPIATGVIAMDEDDSGELRYEVMYFLEAPDNAIDGFKDAWGGIGDSIVVVGGDGLYNCHIHTNDVGASIEAAIDVGRPRQIRVTDLTDQVEEERWVRQATGQASGSADDSLTVTAGGVAPVTAVVTVGTGEGIKRVFHSLGVQRIVQGGQSMNPSTAEILHMIDDAPGSEVIVLPNNSNIYPVAAQAATLSKKPVFVVKTAGVQEAFAALLDYDPACSAKENAQLMTEAASRVVCGEVTQAVRATTTPAGEVKAGDFIGLSRSGIESIAESLADATTALIDILLGDEHEIVTLIEGTAVNAGQLRQVTEWMADKHPKITLERIQGDQPLYPFFISIE